MKALKSVLIACSLSAALSATAAHAQTPAPADNGQQVAQAHAQQANSTVQEGRVATPSKKPDDCVGPVSYCNLYFGS